VFPGWAIGHTYITAKRDISLTLTFTQLSHWLQYSQTPASENASLVIFANFLKCEHISISM